MQPDNSTPSAPLASSAVHQRLREQILSGEIAPGEAVPSERALSEQMGVNRHAVREALKRLQQAGLIQISQGGSTLVRDWRDSAGLELMLDLVEHGSEPPAQLMRSVLEMRASIGIDAARRCAERAEAGQRREVRELAEAVAEAADLRGPLASAEPFVTMWQQIVDGSGNLAYRLGLNSLNSALAAYPQLGERLAPSDSGSLVALGEAIDAGDGAAAGEVARRLLEPDIELADQG